MKRQAVSTLALCFILILMNAPSTLAGPPFRTDDPEPVEYKHWEFYIGHTYSNDKDGVSGTAPHFEANYGDHQTGYTIGALIDFTENHHLICSAGTDIHGQNLFSYYIAYLWTWGPPEKKNK